MWVKGTFALGALLALSLANGFAAQSPDQEKPIPGVQGYRKWAVANPTAFYVPSSVSRLCRNLTDAETKQYTADEREKNPHSGTFVRVYVNPVGEKAFLNPKETNFPVGTVIVKEKFPAQVPKAPELLTVMVKRKLGFDSKNGDWDYFVLSGDAGKLLPSTKQHCQECHLRVQKSGYLYRNYLPAPDTKTERNAR